MTVENAPDGNGAKEKWEEAGFKTEDEMIEAAKATADLRSKIAEAESTLEKERSAKSKTNADYLRQSNEIGDLRKKLKELEDKKPPNDKAVETKTELTDDEVLESVSAEEGAAFDAILNDPKQVELKKRVALGGTKAMAEFVKAYRTEAPVDLAKPLFAGLKSKKDNTVERSSIAKEVQALFKQHETESKNELAATGAGGTSPQQRSKTTGQRTVYGGVTADYYRAKT